MYLLALFNGLLGGLHGLLGLLGQYLGGGGKVGRGHFTELVTAHQRLGALVTQAYADNEELRADSAFDAYKPSKK
jgi:hypothetical protein